MSYQLSFSQMNTIFEKWSDEYDIWAPKRIPKAGRYSDTDIIQYGKVRTVEEIVFDERSDYPAKEALSPISQTLFYFTEDEWRESKETSKKILIFMRSCDVHAQHHQERIYLGNGGYEDYYYKRMHNKVRIVLIECACGWDDCFCVSMGTNRTDDYSMAVRVADGTVLLQVKDETFRSDFDGADPVEFEPAFVEKNETTVEIPEIPDKETLNALKKHPMWQEFNSRCISCGACTVACSTCTCFTATDVIYGDNANVGERRRRTASCQIEGFDQMAGQRELRPTAADRMRYKVLHKFHDYKARFGDYHMCVGCGRCISRCPEFISITATVEKMSGALEEIRAAEKGE
ncbi:MAG: anaerobic sulfite reductase subunit AsrA [Clostridiales bacterium]|nr:anaerobic sulfite reductase subunit AsrA [Clostridiales bacterium]